MRSIILLGASGSIGRQTLDVMKKHRDDFSLLAFSVGNKTRFITPIINRFPEVKHICVKDERKAKEYMKKYPDIIFYHGDEGLIKLIEKSEGELVVNALVGFVGFYPTIAALEHNKHVALANKESLVVGGEIVNKLLNEGKGKLFPIDSEHAAISKCLDVKSDSVKRIILTASGGAFRDLSRDELKSVKAVDALKHPTWKMGNKITIDCATMVNKCFEIIEAHYLFNVPNSKIDVILHKESCVHSMVQYNDGTYRADISKPDMRNPIKYALYEKMTDFKTFAANDYHDFGNYTFKDFDINRYPVIKWASYVIKHKGTYGAVLNASNEEAVYAYLNDEIPFLMIEFIIEKMMATHKNIINPTVEDIINTDRLVRMETHKMIEKWRNNRR